MKDKLTLVILSIAISTSVLGVGIIVPFLPMYAESMGANGLWLGIIFAGFSISRAIFMPVMGKLSDRKGRKLFISFGLFIYSLVSLAYIAAVSPFTLTIVRLGHGFASAMVLPIATAYIADITPKNQEGAYIGYFQAAFFSGFGLGPLMGGFIQDLLGINANFYAMGILSFIAFTLVLLRIPERNQRRLKNEKQESVRYRHLLKSKTIQAIFIIRFTTAFGRGTVLVFFPVFAHKALYLSTTQIGVAMSTYVLLTGLLQRPFGRLADRRNRTGMVVLGSLLSVCAICLFPITENMMQVIILSLMMALGGGISLPAITATTVRHGKTMGYGMGMLMGLFYLAMAAGLATGPIVNGVIFDYLGLEAPFYFGALVLLGGTTLFALSPSEYRTRNNE